MFGFLKKKSIPKVYKNGLRMMKYEDFEYKGKDRILLYGPIWANCDIIVEDQYGKEFTYSTPVVKKRTEEQESVKCELSVLLTNRNMILEFDLRTYEPDTV